MARFSRDGKGGRSRGERFVHGMAKAFDLGNLVPARSKRIAPDTVEAAVRQDMATVAGDLNRAVVVVMKPGRRTVSATSSPTPKSARRRGATTVIPT